MSREKLFLNSLSAYGFGLIGTPWHGIDAFPGGSEAASVTR